MFLAQFKNKLASFWRIDPKRSSSLQISCENRKQVKMSDMIQGEGKALSIDSKEKKSKQCLEITAKKVQPPEEVIENEESTEYKNPRFKHLNLKHKKEDHLDCLVSDCGTEDEPQLNPNSAQHDQMLLTEHQSHEDGSNQASHPQPNHSLRSISHHAERNQTRIFDNEDSKDENQKKINPEERNNAYRIKPCYLSSIIPNQIRQDSTKDKDKKGQQRSPAKRYHISIKQSSRVIKQIQEECSVCREPMHIRQSLQLACTHRFHSQCAQTMKWKNSYKCNICERRKHVKNPNYTASRQAKMN